MTELDDTDALNKFDIHLLTDDSMEYCFKWTVKKFSRLPDKEQFESISFQPMPGYDWKLYLEKNDDDLYLYLENKFEKKITTKICLKIYDSDGKCWHSFKDTCSFDRNEKIDILDNVESIYNDLHNLKDDTLIILCKFNIIGIFTTKCCVSDFTPKKHDGRAKLSEDLRTFLVNKQHADITLKLNGGEMTVNKAILCARSPVFDRMFRHNLEEQETSSVQIDDVSFAVFKKFIEFLYSGELDAESDYDSAAALYFAADKYQVLDLRKMCSGTLKSLIAVENVTETLVFADRHEDEVLKNHALTFLCNNFCGVARSETWDEFVSTQTKLAAQVIKYYSKTTAVATKTP